MENNPSSKPQNDPPLPVALPETKMETRSHLDKLADVFLPDDLNSISNNIVNQIIIPAILKTAGDIIHRSIDMIFGTNYTGTNSQSKSSDPAYMPYGASTRNNTASQPVGTTQIIPIRNGVYDYTIVKFRSVAAAQDVVNKMRAVLSNTGQCSVGKYLEFAQMKTIPEDYNYGWLNLTTISLDSTGDRDYPYRMNLPAPVALPRANDRLFI